MSRLFFLGPIGLVLCLLAGPASGQFLEFRADQLGVPVDPADRGVRLLALGGMQFVIPDENNEINLADFGRNLAGIAADKDGWSVEGSFSRYRQTDDFLTTRRGVSFAQRQAVDVATGTTQAIYRNGQGRAIGIRYAWLGHSSEIRAGDDSRVRGPAFSAIWNETIGDLGLALGVTRLSDEETLTSSNVFNLHHESAVWRYSLAASYPYFGFEWGGQLDLEEVVILGTSRDPSGFHQDDFEWLRPTRKGRITATLPPGGDLELGANLSFFDLEGAEDARISWSDRFPSNPGGFNFDREVPTFREEENGLRFEARALYWLGYAPRVGGFFAVEDYSSEVVESPNFIGSRRQGAVDGTRTEFGGGIGTSFFEERVTVAVEGQVELTEDDITDAKGVASKVSGRDAVGRFGVEWFARRDLALRGGFELLSTDPDTDAPFTLQTGSAASFGFGWVPSGAIYTVDGMFRYVNREPDVLGGPSREVDSFELGLYTRLLF